MPNHCIGVKRPKSTQIFALSKKLAIFIFIENNLGHTILSCRRPKNNVQYPIFEEVTWPTHKYLQIGLYSQNFEFIGYLKVLEGKIAFREKTFLRF